MTAEQRDELMRLAQQAFGSPALMESLARLDANLQALRPGEDWGGSRAVRRRQGRSGLGDGTGVLQDLADLDAAGRAALAVLRRRAGWTTSTSTSWPASSATRPRSTPAPSPSWSRRCATRATSSAAPTGSCGSRPKAMRQLGKALLRDVAPADVGPAGRARDPARRRGGRAQRARRGEWAVRRHRAVGRHPHDDQRRGAAAAREGGDAAQRRTTRRRRRRGEGDRGAHPGRGGAAGRHVVLDGDGRPLGADEAHRAGAAPPDHHPVPRRRPAADRASAGTPR